VFNAPGVGETLPTESFHLAFARSHEVDRRPHEQSRAVDVHDATAVLHALLQELRIPNCRLESATLDGFHPGRAARVVVDDQPVGAIGEIAAQVVAALDAAGPIVACELDLGALIEAERAPRFQHGVSRFPASTIDLAFVLADTVPAGAVVKTLSNSGGDLLETVTCFDVFRSDALGPGNVSLAFALQFRANDRTLTDEEVATLRQHCIDAVTSAHAAELRS
jgi:phenylalanyl-tRNA synthetase beta chain